MHYFYSSFAEEKSISCFVTFLSSLQIAIAILFILYSSLSYAQTSRFGPAYEDPNLAFFMFYGVTSLIVQSLNLIQLWKQGLITLSVNTKREILMWTILISAYFASSSAINGASYISFISERRSQLQTSSNWISIYYFQQTLAIVQCIIGLPLNIILVFGIFQRVKKDTLDTRVQVARIEPPKPILLKLDPSFV